MLQETEKILPVSIGLPNGTHTVVPYQGIVILGGKLKLSDVLYVPYLQCNLISIARVCKDLSFSLAYFDDICLF